MYLGAKARGASAVALLAIAVGLCASSAAAATIDVGIIQMFPQAGQQVDFFVTGTENVAGMEFDIQVGDGGSDLGGFDTGPQITDIELINNTIFAAGANPNQTDVLSFPLAAQSTVDITSTVVANGRIATVTFDATGLPPGTQIPLLLSGVAGAFDTQFFSAAGGPIGIGIQNGTIQIIPEPSTTALLAMFFCGSAAACWYRRRRADH